MKWLLLAISCYLLLAFGFVVYHELEKVVPKEYNDMECPALFAAFVFLYFIPSLVGVSIGTMNFIERINGD